MKLKFFSKKTRIGSMPRTEKRKRHLERCWNGILRVRELVEGQDKMEEDLEKMFKNRGQ